MDFHDSYISGFDIRLNVNKYIVHANYIVLLAFWE